MAKLAPKNMRFILPLILTFFMTCVVSLISVLRAMGGFGEGFFSVWLSSWMIAWAVAYPAMIIFMPVAKRLAFLVVERPQS